jgi:hypothetical protein
VSAGGSASTLASRSLPLLEAMLEGEEEALEREDAVVGDGVVEAVEAVDDHVDTSAKHQILPGVAARQHGYEVLVGSGRSGAVDARAGAEEGCDLSL